MTTIEALIARYLPSLVELRRELHQHPELAYHEFDTARLLLQRLEQIPGLDIRRGIAETGIVATLGIEKAGPCVALRSDMDALPIVELTGKPYASVNPSRMHACGHDGHMACLIGAALVLAELEASLAGPVKFIFQPAEEAGPGAERMCAEGALREPSVDAVFGFHCWPWLEQGQLGVRAGAVMGSADQFVIEIRGVGAHAAVPHLSIDPVVIASHLVLALQGVVSRVTDPLDAVVLTIGSIHAGSVPNIIPETATLSGTMRALSPTARSRGLAALERIVAELPGAFGAQASLSYIERYPSVVNDRDAVEYFRTVAEAVIPPDLIREDVFPVLIAEDFSFYGREAPACFWALGIRPADATSFPALHQPTFDFPDEMIATGVRLHCEVALGFSQFKSVRLG